MPGGDGSGPRGAGSMTGRALGFCAGFDDPGYAQRGAGRGPGQQRGGCRGRRNVYHATGLPGYLRDARCTFTTEQERQALERQSALLERQLEQISSRIASLDEER
ncbi:MAG: DUF5320 domain-containing protein [Anaerolineae bacterium]